MGSMEVHKVLCVPRKMCVISVCVYGLCVCVISVCVVSVCVASVCVAEAEAGGGGKRDET